MTIAVIVGFAIVVEALVNILFGDLKSKKWSWVKKISAFVFGIGLCVIWKVQILAVVGMVSTVKFANVADQVVTGIIVSRGSNYINKYIVQRLTLNATSTTTTTTTPPDTSTDDTTTVTSTTTPST